MRHRADQSSASLLRDRQAGEEAKRFYINTAVLLPSGGARGGGGVNSIQAFVLQRSPDFQTCKQSQRAGDIPATPYPDPIALSDRRRARPNYRLPTGRLTRLRLADRGSTFELVLPRVRLTRVGAERERKFNLSIQPALAYEDVSMLESSAKLRMAAKQ